MAVNPDLVGREFPPTPPYLVGREKVREFARAVLAQSLQHHDVEAARALLDAAEAADHGGQTDGGRRKRGVRHGGILALGRRDGAVRPILGPARAV